MKGKKWVFIPCDEEKIEYLSNQCHITKLVARLLVNRGFSIPEEAEQFLRADAVISFDPFLLADMDKACERIARALRNKEKITVYGDYDVDGVTATVLLVTYLKKAGALVDYYIPDRLKEGYGINREALEQIKGQGSALVITVDTGITACEEVDWAKRQGIDVIITDHHECKGKIPDAVAVVNPKRPGSSYPFYDLAGVGVAYKLVCALSGEPEQTLEEYCDLVSIGTIADVMPLTGENRSIVKKGLRRLSKNPGAGVRALFVNAGVDYGKKMTSGIIGYIVAPRINAAGRIGCPSTAARLLLTENYKEALAIAEQLCAENKKRQSKENEILAEAVAILEEKPGKKERKVLVLWGEGWHNGVIGIVASKLSEKYGRPVILVSFEGGTGKGSGRSVPGFNLYEALKAMAPYLEKFGGHSLAAGLTIPRENIEAFEEEINRYAHHLIDLEDLAPAVLVEGELEQEDLALKTVLDIDQLQPFGTGNSLPVFAVRDLEILDITALSNDKHLNFTVLKGERKFSALAFSVSPGQNPFAAGDRVDMIGTLDINTYRGIENLQFIISDMRLSQAQQDQLAREQRLLNAYFENGYLTEEEYGFLTPDRSCFVDLYRYVKQRLNGGVFFDRFDGLYRKIGKDAKNPAFGHAKMMICLAVLKELAILNYEIKENIITIHIFEVQGKIELGNSQILQRLARLRQEVV